MSETAQKITIKEIAEIVDIPDSAYEKAEKRYHDLGEWFKDPRAKCSQFSPHIYPQGSFRLGTVNRPVGESEQYDLDMGCRLQQGISKSTWSQQQLKELVRADLESYRTMRRIKDEVEEKHRCLCLNYADDLSFHMDVVPSIPEQEELRKSLSESMIQRGEDAGLAISVAAQAGSITDNRLPNYEKISSEWLVSNSQGYAIWFESRMRLELELLEKSVKRSVEAQIDKLPLYKRRSPLQRSIQVLKRHRDWMFADDADRKPASIILTTLAAQAYRGETDVVTATINILDRMGDMVQHNRPHVPNPINPNEDFADRWYTDRGLELDLKGSFWTWLRQAQEDIGSLAESDDQEYLMEKSLKGFGVNLDRDSLQRSLRGITTTAGTTITGLATSVQSTPIHLTDPSARVEALRRAASAVTTPSKPWLNR